MIELPAPASPASAEASLPGTPMASGTNFDAMSGQKLRKGRLPLADLLDSKAQLVTPLGAFSPPPETPAPLWGSSFGMQAAAVAAASVFPPVSQEALATAAIRFMDPVEMLVDPAERGEMLGSPTPSWQPWQMPQQSTSWLPSSTFGTSVQSEVTADRCYAQGSDLNECLTSLDEVVKGLAADMAGLWSDPTERRSIRI